ncbi:unnamed protein product [Orchesella dallaii]|uniref:NB-ARC domain-containing protein n=1 Tax=Orchesella dallaii TaxID=48710 RepID=A0ABP1PJI0_9HEXA
MEDQEKKHIVRNLTELVDNTKWNTTCITIPMEAGVFGADDISLLESIPNERMRVLEFYRIFMTKHNSYQHLIATVSKAYQSGAVKILSELDPTKYSFQWEQQISPRSTNEANQTGQTIQQPAAVSIFNIPMRILGFFRRTPTNQHLYHQQGGTTEDEPNKNAKTTQQRGTSLNTSQRSLSVRFDVLNPTRLFTGRMKELRELHEKLQKSKNKPAVVSQMTSVAGLGGIGKTELARMFIQKYSEEFNNNVIWISAETEDTLAESFRRLATDYLKLAQKNVDGNEKHQKTLIDEVYKFFEHKTCLFVFDNAESNEVLQKFLPLQVANPPFVLITSRDREWAFVVEMLELNEMEEIDAISLVKTGLGIQDTTQDDMVVQLVKALQCYPLALCQAISYIKQQNVFQNYSIAEYLEEYKSRSEILLNCEIRPAAVCTYTKTTLTTWKLTTELILANKECGKKAMRMLNMVSYFQPDKIPIKLLLSDNTGTAEKQTAAEENSTISSNETHPAEKNKKALQLLEKYSMVNIQPKEQTISIHRLVQEVTRIELRRNEQEEATLKHALQLLSGNVELTCTCINHFCSVYKYCQAYKKLVLDFKDVPWRILQELHTDSTSIRFYSGVSVGNELKETLQKHVSSDNVDVVQLKRWIAVANYRAGNFEAAIKIFEQILPAYLENKAGLFTKKDTLNVQNFLSVCLKETGKRSECLKSMLQTYESSKAVHGLNHWWTIQALVETANCLRELGHFKKPFVENAEYLQGLNSDLSVLEPLEIVSLLKAAYENNKHLISSDSSYSRRMRSIASFFYNIGDNDTASTIANYVYQIGRNSNYTKIQVEAMKCLNLLSILKSKEGKHEDALEKYKEIHTFSSKTIGSSHIDTLTYKTNMLIELRVLGQPEAALVGFHDVLETLMKNYPNHPDVFQTELRIGVTLFKLKKHEESLALLVNLRKRIEDRFGPTFPLLSDVTYSIENVKKFVVNEDLTH